jgi:peptidyl-tRNA hydrolase, PTH1 family
MALLQKQPIVENVTPLFTLNATKTLLIVGLGNIGDEYNNTRHNIGFMAIDDFANKNNFDGWVNKKDLKCHLTQKTFGQTRIILVKPTTYMNLSGEAMQKVQHFYKVSNDKTIAIYDELDIDFGQIRTRTGGSAAGHNGMKSLIQHCGEGFGRVRIGVGPKLHEQQDSTDFVLSRFSKEQEAKLPKLYDEINSILTDTIYGEELFAETRSF